MELFRALAVLAEPPTPASARLADLLELGTAPNAADFANLFLFQVYPYASVYTGAEGALGGEARDRVAGFWRVLGLQPPAEPDHLSALLGLYAELGERSRTAAVDRERDMWHRARAALLWEHLLSWIMPFLTKVTEIAAPPFAAWAGVLRTALLDEARATPPPPGLPLHLRIAPGLPDAGAGIDAWLQALLAPVRSGIILTRADLARAAHDLGLGRRAGDRLAALRVLLEQDAPRVAAWLAAKARAAAASYGLGATRDLHDGLGSIADFWATRARSTAHALDGALAGEITHGS